MEKQTIICIGRQYGSGGREIGEKIAAQLGVVCYDKLLLQKTAQSSGLALSAVEDNDEKPIGLSSLVSCNFFADTAAISSVFYSERQRVYKAQQKIILDLAHRGSCVMIGRCASSSLRSAGFDVLSVFVYADEKDRVNRIAARNGIDLKTAKQKMKKIDRMRRKYFDFYSDTQWGQPESYDLMVSSSYCGIDGCVALIEQMLSDRKAKETSDE